jgi:2-dehydropantoate 2-reductase
MLEDYANGRALELGAIADAVFELAEAAAVSMPLARSITDLARYKASARPEER